MRSYPGFIELLIIRKLHLINFIILIYQLQIYENLKYDYIKWCVSFHKKLIIRQLSIKNSERRCHL